MFRLVHAKNVTCKVPLPRRRRTIVNRNVQFAPPPHPNPLPSLACAMGTRLHYGIGEKWKPHMPSMRSAWRTECLRVTPGQPPVPVKTSRVSANSDGQGLGLSSLSCTPCLETRFEVDFLELERNPGLGSF